MDKFILNTFASVLPALKGAFKSKSYIALTKVAKLSVSDVSMPTSNPHEPEVQPSDGLTRSSHDDDDDDDNHPTEAPPTCWSKLLFAKGSESEDG